MNKVQVYIKCILLSAFIFTGHSETRAQTSELVQKIIINLDSSYKYFEADNYKQDLISRQYDSLFNLLVNNQRTNPSPLINELTLQNKLVAIAKHKVLNAALFTEIEQKYIYGTGNTSTRAVFSPALQTQHVAERYRLVWEYFLLKPPASGMSAQYDMRAADALARINNPASLVTIERVYAGSTKTITPLDYPVIRKQKLMLLTIGKMPSDSGAVSLTRLVALPLQRKDSLVKVDWRPREFVKDMLKGKQRLKTENSWKIIMRRAENNKNLDVNTRKILREIKD